MRKSIITAQCFLFVLVMLIGVTATADTNPGYVVRACDLMDEPYRDAKAVAALEEGTDVEILKRKGGWLNITAGDHTGWVRMSKIRKGEAAAKPDSGTEAKGVLDLASGRAGTGNVVSATGVRGLSEEDLKEAKFNASEIKKMESFTVSNKQASKFAKEGKLSAKTVEFLSENTTY